MHSKGSVAFVGLVAALTHLGSPAPTFGSALQKLKKGDAVEVTGTWDPEQRIFVAAKIERLSERRRPSARGAIESLDGRSARFRLFGRDVQVDDATVFASATGENGGRLSDLRAGMRVEVSAEADGKGVWKAKKVEWREVKASDKVKGTVSEVGPREGSSERIRISGLGVRVTEGTELETDYLQEELLGTLFSDEGDVNVPHLRLGPLRLAGYGRLSTRRDAGYTLSGEDDDSVVGEPALALQVAGDWGRSAQTLVDVRLGNEGTWDGDRFDSTEAQLEVLQAYALLRTPKERGVALLVGKQRLRDHREWLFDEYLDALRLYAYVTRPLVLEASYIHSVFPPAGESFATWDDLLLRARLIPDSRSEANVYWLKRRDSSARGREPVYWGLSYSGRPKRWLRGWLEAALLRGEDKGRRQEAYALDLGATFSTTGRVRPSITLAYALGSGEEKSATDPTSQEFRQTGYEDNSGRFGGFSSFKYYGEVLDPELSNLEVMTVGAGIRFGYSVSADAVFHVYRQPRPDDELRSALAPEELPDGDSRDLGREVDFILGVQNLWKRVSLSYGFGLFIPGQALDASDRRATRHRLSVRVAF
jgi:alginate production protein